MATEKIAMHYFRSSEESPALALRSAVQQANSEIHQRGQNNPEFYNMGTTASTLAILESGALVAHVGDSRVYRLREDKLEQLTFDHSLVWEMEASGHSDSGMWGSSIPKNVITRSLGPNESVEVDIEGPFEIAPGDCFLLCSDGLTGQVDDTEIGTLLKCLPEDLATRVLVDLANLRGGPDNTTVVVVRVKDRLGEEKLDRKPKQSASTLRHVSPLLWGCLAICLIGASFLAVTQMWGPMIVAIILAILSGVACGVQYHQYQKSHPVAKPASGGKGPYRSYRADASSELYERLGRTVQALREAAEQKNWLMDWKKVTELQNQGRGALKRKETSAAILYQAKAVVETMNQLREQHNRSANETAIDL